MSEDITEAIETADTIYGWHRIADARAAEIVRLHNENEELRQLNSNLFLQNKSLVEQRDRLNDMHQFEIDRAEKAESERDELLVECSKAGVGPCVGNYFLGKLTIQGELTALREDVKPLLKSVQSTLSIMPNTDHICTLGADISVDEQNRHFELYRFAQQGRQAHQDFLSKHPELK